MPVKQNPNTGGRCHSKPETIRPLEGRSGLEPDVQAYVPDAEGVNTALPGLIRIVSASFVCAILQLLGLSAVTPGLHRPLLAQVVFEQPLDDGLLGLIGLRHMDPQGADE